MRLVIVNVNSIYIGQQRLGAGHRLIVSDSEYNNLVDADRLSDGSLTDDGVPTREEIYDPAIYRTAIAQDEITAEALGTLGTRTYSYRQNEPASQWVLIHNLGTARQPTILLDAEPGRPVWTDVEYPDLTTTIITLPEPSTGWAYL